MKERCSRFDQPDPYDGSYDLADPQSFNRYSYVQNDPVNSVDPTGLQGSGPGGQPGVWVTDPATGQPFFIPAGQFGVTVNIGGTSSSSNGLPGGGAGSILGGDVMFIPEDGPVGGETGGIVGGGQEPRPQPHPTPTPQPQPQNCGVNPTTGQAGYRTSPINQVGNMRDDGRRGHGWFGASRGGGTRSHTGIDITGNLNQTPVVAFLPGTVIAMGPSGKMGNRVIIDHGNGLTSHYGHLQTGSIRGAGISSRQTVQQGQQIGTVGNTGNAGNSTAHVHFEIRRNGVPQNPANILNGRCPR